jgi:hypothetical protein
MKFVEIEMILGKPTRVGPLAIATGPAIAGRVHVNLSEPTYSDLHYSAWLCMLPQDDSVPLGTQESAGRYCLAVEDERGDWSISASCKLHAAVLRD